MIESSQHNPAGVEKIDVSYVAHLARLHLSEAEVGRLQAQLEDIVGYVHKIGDLDVSRIEPTSHTRLVTNVFREDAVKPGLPHEAVMANAPAGRDGQFVVPKIVE